MKFLIWGDENSWKEDIWVRISRLVQNLPQGSWLKKKKILDAWIKFISFNILILGDKLLQSRGGWHATAASLMMACFRLKLIWLAVTDSWLPLSGIIWWSKIKMNQITRPLIIVMHNLVISHNDSLICRWRSRFW